MNQAALGGSFDAFLKEDGIYDECHDAAVKKILAYQLQAEMARRHISKTELAKGLETSRAALDRLLSPENDAVTLRTIKKAAAFLGKRVHLEIV